MRGGGGGGCAWDSAAICACIGVLQESISESLLSEPLISESLISEHMHLCAAGLCVLQLRVTDIRVADIRVARIRALPKRRIWECAYGREERREGVCAGSRACAAICGGVGWGGWAGWGWGVGGGRLGQRHDLDVLHLLVEGLHLRDIRVTDIRVTDPGH